VKVLVIRVLRNVLWSRKEITGDNYMIGSMSVCGIAPNKYY